MNEQKPMMMFLRSRCLSGRQGRKLWGLCCILLLFAGKTVQGEPYIVEQPESETAVAGETITFSVKVGQTNSTSPLSVLWRRNGKNLPESLTTFYNVSGTKTALLTITNAGPPSAAGNYKAVVYDEQKTIQSRPVTLSFPNLRALEANDKFADRGELPGASGKGQANNIDAISEPGSPKNDSIPGGKMVWLEWTAPDSGTAFISTKGSDFDTTLGIYKQTNRDSSDVSGLVAVTGDDDSGDFYTSAVQFNVVQGDIFVIGIDGYYGSRGQIVLNWDIQSTEYPLPEIIEQPQSQVVLPFVPVWLSVEADVSSNRPALTYQWFFNDEPLQDENDSMLYLSRADESVVGQYQVKVGLQNMDDSYSVFSKKVQVQINKEGNSQALAGAKLFETANSNSSTGELVAQMVPVSGYTGTHIFSTYGSAHEPGEPDHCGQVGGSSTWFSCLPTKSGTLKVDADTTYNAVLAAYTWPGGTNYSDLIPIGGSYTNPGIGHEAVEVSVSSGTTCYLVVDGTDGAYGTVTLSLEFSAPPQISLHPQSRTVPQGSNATLNVSASGIPDPVYQWRMEGNKFSGQTNTSLTISCFSGADQGCYDVVVSNSVGSVTSSVASLFLAEPLRLADFALCPTGLSMLILGAADSNYVVEASSDLTLTNWVPVYTNCSSCGILPFGDTNVSLYTQRFYRVRSQ